MSFATTFVRATCRANTSQVFGAARTALRTQAPKGLFLHRATMSGTTASFKQAVTPLFSAQTSRWVAVAAAGFGVVGLSYASGKLSPALAEGVEDFDKDAAAASAGPTLMQKCVAEAIGTGMIIGGGCGAVCAAKYGGSPFGLFGIAVGFGASVMLAVFATRDISGAHLNPAVTAALAINRPGSIATEEIAPYMAAQMFGATVASTLNYLCFRGGISALETASKLKRGAAGSAAMFDGAFGMVPNKLFVRGPGAFMAEALCTSALVFVIFTCTDAAKSVPANAAPVLIGTTVTTLALQFAPITGCGMNPARDLGPRLVTMAAGWGGAALSTGWWAYTLGPFAGAIAGGALYNLINA